MVLMHQCVLARGSCRPLPTLCRSPTAVHRARRTMPGMQCRPAASASTAATTGVDVAIIGGGPGGLAAAYALAVAMPALHIAVYERVPALIKRGAGVALDPNGQKALRAINPELWDAAKAQSTSSPYFTMHDPQGRLFQEVDNAAPHNSWKAKYGYSGFMMAWADLQRLLADRLPAKVELHLGQQFDRYEEEPDNGTVHLHLAGQDTPATAKLLVAADGYYSKVRAQCLADGHPNWAGTAVWRAIVAEESSVLNGSGFARGASRWYVGDYLSCLVFPVSNDHVVWAAFAPEAQLKDAGMDFLSLKSQRLNFSAQAGDFEQRTAMLGQAAKERCLKVFSKFPEELKHMIMATDDSAMVEHGLYTRPAEAMTPDSYGRGRVVIIGDAAHPMRPTGQGLNQALEDAYHLGHAVQQAGAITDEALAAYRARRAQRMVPVVAQSDMQGQASYAQDAKVAAEKLRPPEAYEDYLYSMELEPLGFRA